MYGPCILLLWLWMKQSKLIVCVQGYFECRRSFLAQKYPICDNKAKKESLKLFESYMRFVWQWHWKKYTRVYRGFCLGLKDNNFLVSFVYILLMCFRKISWKLCQYFFFYTDWFEVSNEMQICEIGNCCYLSDTIENISHAPCQRIQSEIQIIA